MERSVGGATLWGCLVDGAVHESGGGSGVIAVVAFGDGAVGVYGGVDLDLERGEADDLGGEGGALAGFDGASDGLFKEGGAALLGVSCVEAHEHVAED